MHAQPAHCSAALAGSSRGPACRDAAGHPRQLWVFTTGRRHSLNRCAPCPPNPTNRTRRDPSGGADAQPQDVDPRFPVRRGRGARGEPMAHCRPPARCCTCRGRVLKRPPALLPGLPRACLQSCPGRGAHLPPGLPARRAGSRTRREAGGACAPRPRVPTPCASCRRAAAQRCQRLLRWWARLCWHEFMLMPSAGAPPSDAPAAAGAGAGGRRPCQPAAEPGAAHTPGARAAVSWRGFCTAWWIWIQALPCAGLAHVHRVADDPPPTYPLRAPQRGGSAPAAPRVAARAAPAVAGALPRCRVPGAAGDAPPRPPGGG